MKKLQLLVLMLAANFSFVYAQEVEEEYLESEVEISMDFNKSLYPVTFGNTFVSETPKAALFATINPQSFDDAIKEFEKDFTEGELKNVKSGTTEIKGQKVFYVTGNMIDKESGILVMLEILMKPATKDSSIVIMSMYDSQSKKIFEQEGKKAIASAKIM